jgi:hypothetical protein
VILVPPRKSHCRPLSSFRSLQAGVRDLVAAEIEHLQALESLQVLQIGVRDVGDSEVNTDYWPAREILVPLHLAAQLEDRAYGLFFLVRWLLAICRKTHCKRQQQGNLAHHDLASGK